MIYPSVPETSERLLTLCFRHFWGSFKRIFWLILVLVALKSFFTYLPALPSLIEVPLAIITTLAVLFILVMVLYRVDAFWQGKLFTWQQTWERTLRRIVRIYLASFFLWLALALIYFVARWISISFMGLTGISLAISALFFIGVPYIMILIYFYLVIPLLALTDISFLKACRDSAVYNQKHLLFAFLFYIEVSIILFISSTFPRHSQWLLQHHLMEATDAVVFSLFLPFMINQILLLINNAKIIEKLPENK